MKSVRGLALSLALLSAPSLASSLVDDLSDAPRNWSAPPYWTPPPHLAGAQAARSELATGRQALVTTPTPLPFIALTPCRVINTRPIAVPFPFPWGPPALVPGGAQRTFPIVGQCGVPADARAVAVNFTIVGGTADGDLRVFPAGGATPTAATMAWTAPVFALSDGAVMPLGPTTSTAGFTVQLDSPAGLDLIVDIDGYYSPLGVVNSLNGQAGDLTLTAGTNVTITPGAGTLTIDATAGGPPSGPAGGSLAGTYPNPGLLGGPFATLAANTFTGTQTISVGNFDLPATAGPTVGVLTVNGQSFLHAFGGLTNAFVGAFAGGALATTGGLNAAFGFNSLFSNTTGLNNTACGAATLEFNTTGAGNTAVGMNSLRTNTIGNGNTAVGQSSLFLNTTGGDNAAFGSASLTSNTTGGSNAAFGTNSLRLNTIGFSNAAFGAGSLFSNTTGVNNTASGGSSLFANLTGADNAAFGTQSLAFNTTGSGNIAIGFGAGLNLTTGDSNIDIGNAGGAGEAATTRIGTAGLQTRTFISGIRGVTTGGAGVAVLVDTNGQLGTISSSRRYKDDIADMDATSSGLMALRPVTFHYKTDRNPSVRTLQYGLIAEEVAEVYPGLVARSAGGQIETVLYQFLPPMLLNEYQKQQRTIQAQAAEIEAQRAQIDRLENVTARLEARLAQAEARLAETP